MPDDEIQKLQAAARRTDPLFGSVERDFEPTIDDVIQMIEIEGQPYDFPRSSRSRMTLSFDPDRLAAVQSMASDYDMSTSAMVDALLRVALGDYAEWWNRNGDHFEKAKKEGEE